MPGWAAAIRQNGDELKAVSFLFRESIASKIAQPATNLNKNKWEINDLQDCQPLVQSGWNWPNARGRRQTALGSWGNEVKMK